MYTAGRSLVRSYLSRDGLGLRQSAGHSDWRRKPDCRRSVHPQGAFRAVYGSLNLETALDEVLAHHRRQGLPEVEALPLTFVGLQVDAQRVLDLTDGRIRRALGISAKRIASEPWRALQNTGQEASTQAIGRLAWHAGLQGLFVPSAIQRMGRNLVLFPDRLLPGQLVIVHGERLPVRRGRRRN